jgi:hypothetical protein
MAFRFQRNRLKNEGRRRRFFGRDRNQRVKFFDVNLLGKDDFDKRFFTFRDSQKISMLFEKIIFQ